MLDTFPTIDTGNSALVIGSAGIDLVGRLESDLKPATSNPALIRCSYGGVARNLAENLARLGQSVSLISVVGKDVGGDDILEYTSNTGVDVSAVLQCENYPTGNYMGVVDENGVLQFAIDDMRLLEEITPQIT